MSREERIKEIEVIANLNKRCWVDKDGLITVPKSRNGCGYEDPDILFNELILLVREQQEEINKLKECLNNQLSLNLCLSKQINKGEVK